jgi:phosphomannomutase
LSTLHVDCANGVGAPKLRELIKHISSDVLSVDIVNDNTTTLGQLNKNVSTKHKIEWICVANNYKNSVVLIL